MSTLINGYTVALRATIIQNEKCYTVAPQGHHKTKIKMVIQWLWRATIKQQSKWLYRGFQRQIVVGMLYSGYHTPGCPNMLYSGYILLAAPICCTVATILLAAPILTLYNPVCCTRA
jgi:hypothetical protein